MGWSHNVKSSPASTVGNGNTSTDSVTSSVQPFPSVTNSVTENGSTDTSITADAAVLVAPVTPGVTLALQEKT